MNLNTQADAPDGFGDIKTRADFGLPSAAGRSRALLFCIAFFGLWFLSLSCGSPPTDPRTLIPADALVYLETRDLGAALREITENKAFTQLAARRPNLGVLSGVSVAAAVTGFQTREQAVTEDSSILNFQARFVAVAETGMWNFQALRFTENDIGAFVNDAYGGEVVADIVDRPDGKFYEWTSPAGQKAYALVAGSVIFFGNDESAIERCLAVKRGEADSIAKNTRIGDGERLAFGFVSNEGVAQISNILGVLLAMQSSEEGEVKGFVARVLPEILRNSTKELTWTATKTEKGIEDRFIITSQGDLAAILSETIVPAPRGAGANEYLLPPNATSVTRYNLNDPQIAWRSILLSAQHLAGDFNGEIISSFAGSVFEPYGIDNPELFLSAVGPVIHTVKYEPDDERSIVIADARDIDKIMRSVKGEIDFSRPPENRDGATVRKSDDGETAFITIDKTVIIGESEAAEKFVTWRLRREPSAESSGIFSEFSSSDAAAVTAASDVETAAKIVDLFTERKDTNESVRLRYVTESRFNRNGIERLTISDFGLFGSIITYFSRQ